MLVPGFQNGLRVAHGGASLAWDGRSHDRDGSGVSASIDATYAHGLGSDPSQHATFTGEVVGAVGFGDRQLLLRGQAATVRALGDAPVPFEELIVPSGYAGMRGFPDGRFRGGTGVVATAEYRWYIAARWDASLFTDVGTVTQGQSFADFRGDRWFPNFGLGLRNYSLPGPHWQGQLNGGVELAYAPDGGFRLLLALAPY
jgi:hemolysin activation/secretion protein